MTHKFCATIGKTKLVRDGELVPFFVFLQSKFLSHISNSIREPESSNVVYTFTLMAKYIEGKKTKMLSLIFALFFYFSISHSNVVHRKICVKCFSGTDLPLFGTNVGYDLLYCVRED